MGNAYWNNLGQTIDYGSWEDLLQLSIHGPIGGTTGTETIETAIRY